MRKRRKSEVSSRKFAEFLLSQVPIYDKQIIASIRPSDPVFTGKVVLCPDMHPKYRLFCNLEEEIYGVLPGGKFNAVQMNKESWWQGGSGK